MVIDLELGADFLHHCIVQIEGIVKNNTFWKAVSINDLFLDEFAYN